MIVMKLKARHFDALQYLSDKMEATARMIGASVAPDKTERGQATIGNRVALDLWYEELVSYLPDLRAYRINQYGRDVLAKWRYRVDILPPVPLLSIPLRRGVTIYIQGLPDDLTAGEAEKLARAISAFTHSCAL